MNKPRASSVFGYGVASAARRAFAQGMRAEPHPYLTAGRRVRIVDGQLAGQEGVLVRRKGNLRVMLSIDLIQRSMLLDVDTFSLESAR